MSDYKVIAIGTGSKCLGENSLNLNGSLVHDSHAEVISKRSLVIYLLYQMEMSYKAKHNKVESSNLIFKYLDKEKRFIIKENIKFHFYSSQPPCGDATIAPKKFDGVLSDNFVDNSSLHHKTKRFKSENNIKHKDIHRTGAKCLDICVNKDSLLEAENLADYHVLGAVRRKPGRGDPTASLSCSDKMGKWNFVGIQGSFLSSLLFSGPILWNSIIISGTNVNIESVKRSMFDRFRNNENFLERVPIIHSSATFPYSKREPGSKEHELIPCSSNIAFSQSDKKVLCHDIMVDGRKQGIIKKHFGTPKERVTICRYNICKRFKELVKHIHQDCPDKTFCKMCNLLSNTMHYKDFKSGSQKLSGWYVKRLNAFYDILPGLKDEREARRNKIDMFQVD